MNQLQPLLYHLHVFRLRELLLRSWPSLILAAALILLLGGVISSPGGPRDLLVLRQRRCELEARRARLIAQQRVLETEVQNLRSNQGYIERLIRSELGYARPNELIYKFPGAGAPQ